MDKHRKLQLPSNVSQDLCIETGIDIGDGTRVLYRPGSRHSSYTYSISQRYPDEWFGCNLVISPLLTRLYGIRPKLRRSSRFRNGLCIYLNSRGILLFKRDALGLRTGTCSRIVSVPPILGRRGKTCVLRFIEGFQYADGSFVAGTRPCVKITTSSLELHSEILEAAAGLSVACSSSRDHPHVGFSTRIYGEDRILGWLKDVPLLNPIQIAKFLVWKEYGECPPGLFLSQYCSILIGESPLRSVTRDAMRNTGRQELFRESVDQLVRFALAKQPLTLSEVTEETVARSLQAAHQSLRRLIKNGEAKRVDENGRNAVGLTTQGIHSISKLEEAWKRLEHVNCRISPLKSYQRDFLRPR